MANYYYINIESEKMTQEVANEIFQTITPKQRVRHFNFSEGHLNYNTRGLVDVTEVLEAYGFNDEEDKIEIKDEFELVYENIDKSINTNILLEEFLNITNVENTYIFTNIEEREHCFNLTLIDSPKIGFNQNNYEDLRFLKIQEINFNGNMISIQLEKINAAT